MASAECGAKRRALPTSAQRLRSLRIRLVDYATPLALSVLVTEEIYFCLWYTNYLINNYVILVLFIYLQYNLCYMYYLLSIEVIIIIIGYRSTQRKPFKCHIITYVKQIALTRLLLAYLNAIELPAILFRRVQFIFKMCYHGDRETIHG